MAFLRLTSLEPSKMVTTKTQTICPAIHRAKSAIGGYVPSVRFQKNITILVSASSKGARPVYTVRIVVEGDAASCPITSKVPLNVCRPIIVNVAGKTKKAMSQGARPERNMALHNHSCYKYVCENSNVVQMVIVSEKKIPKLALTRGFLGFHRAGSSEFGCCRI